MWIKAIVTRLAYVSIVWRAPLAKDLPSAHSVIRSLNEANESKAVHRKDRNVHFICSGFEIKQRPICHWLTESFEPGKS